MEELLQLAGMFDKYEYRLVTEKTDTTSYLEKKYKNVSYLVYGTRDHLLPYLFIFPFNCIKSFFLYLKYRPEVIITTGTHTAVPMCYIAHLFKKKVIWIETLANATTPTKAGKMVYPIADLFLVQYESMLKVYPKAQYWGSLF